MMEQLNRCISGYKMIQRYGCHITQYTFGIIWLLKIYINHPFSTYSPGGLCLAMGLSWAGLMWTAWTSSSDPTVSKKLHVLWSVRNHGILGGDHHQLVGGLEHFLFFHILGIITPIDFHIFSEGLFHHQPAMIFPIQFGAVWRYFESWSFPTI